MEILRTIVTNMAGLAVGALMMQVYMDGPTHIFLFVEGDDADDSERGGARGAHLRRDGGYVFRHD